MESKVWPGIFIHNLDEVVDFEEWFGNLGGNGRYVGDWLHILGGLLVAPGETVTFNEGVWGIGLHDLEK